MCCKYASTYPGQAQAEDYKLSKLSILMNANLKHTMEANRTRPSFKPEPRFKKKNKEKTQNPSNIFQNQIQSKKLFLKKL
jgi:hypothetical protein